MAMNIIKTSRDFTGAELYKATKSQSIKRMSDATGVITVNDYVKYEDVKEDGTAVTILSVITPDGIFATNSSTFIRTFEDIVQIMGELPIDITIGHDTSKNGRSYIYADLA